MPVSFVLGLRLPATYPRGYASVAGFPAASLHGHFEHPEMDARLLSSNKRRMP